MMKRQGDILFAKVKKLPKNLNVKKDQIIARGENTGHKHVLEGGVLLSDPKTGMYIDVAGEKAVVTHDEHSPIDLKFGFYRITRQKEYKPWGGSRRLND